MFTVRQTDNPIFYKVETYLDRFLVPKMYVIPNFVKIVGAVLKIKRIDIHTYNFRSFNDKWGCICIYLLLHGFNINLLLIFLENIDLNKIAI